MPRQAPFGPQDRDQHGIARLTLTTVVEQVQTEVSDLTEKRRIIREAYAKSYSDVQRRLGKPPQADYSSPEAAVPIVIYLSRVDYLSGRHGGRGIAKFPIETAGEAWTRLAMRDRLRSLLTDSIPRAEVTVELGVSGETDGGEAYGNVPLVDEVHVTITPRL